MQTNKQALQKKYEYNIVRRGFESKKKKNKQKSIQKVQTNKTF